MKRRIEHGSALVVAVVVTVIMTLLAMGLIRLGTLETAGAIAGAKREALAQCAEAASQLILSKFHLLGMDPTSITALDVPLDGTKGVVRAVGGHYDTLGVQIEQVVPMDPRAAGPQDEGELTNVIRGPGITQRGMRVIVHCWDNGVPGDPTSGRQLEVELGVRFGL